MSRHHDNKCEQCGRAFEKNKGGTHCMACFADLVYKRTGRVLVSGETLREDNKMSDPLNWMHPLVPGDIITPTEQEIERNLSGAGTFLLAIDDHEIAELYRGKVLCFYLEDMQNVLVRFRGERILTGRSFDGDSDSQGYTSEEYAQL